MSYRTQLLAKVASILATARNKTAGAHIIFDDVLPRMKETDFAIPELKDRVRRLNEKISSRHYQPGARIIELISLICIMEEHSS
jgi:hypothetical protein